MKRPPKSPFTAEDAEPAEDERDQPASERCGLCALCGERLLDSEAPRHDTRFYPVTATDSWD